jgi:hypothetical protein
MVADIAPLKPPPTSRGRFAPAFGHRVKLPGSSTNQPRHRPIDQSACNRATAKSDNFLVLFPKIHGKSSGFF